MFKIVFILIIAIQSSSLLRAEDLGKIGDFSAPEFYHGELIQLADYRGKIIYLDFWASWCAPCRESFPLMQQLHTQYQAKGLQIIAVNIDEDKAAAHKFLDSFPVSFVNLYDPEGQIGKALAVRKMPTSLLIDRDGRILFKHAGFDKSYADALQTTIKNIMSQ